MPQHEALPRQDRSASDCSNEPAPPVRLVGLEEYLSSTYFIDKSPASMQMHTGLARLRHMVINGVEKPYATDKAKFTDWDNPRCLKYGRFLINLIEPEELDYIVITNAARAGIGPGVGGIERRFTSLREFYKELGLAKNNPRNYFENWSHDDFLEYIRGIARLNEGRISENLIRQHYNAAKKAGQKLPSPSVIETATQEKLGILFEEAGLMVPTRPKTAQDCALGAIRFYHINGRWPNSRDIAVTPYMPSWPTVRRYCGSMPGLISLAEEMLEQEELDELAA